ncbi:MAG: hypothetical protein OEY29_10190 [Gammaproteobacteria bacterium]|nr:hypothetical protein [Gammaproteobacteria bacterium]
MKTVVNIIILSMIAGAGYYFYQENKGELNKTIDTVKNTTVESVTKDVIEKVKSIDSSELMELAANNKDMLIELMDKNDIKLENIDMAQLKKKLEENGISLDSINLQDAGVEEKVKDLFNAVSK